MQDLPLHVQFPVTIYSPARGPVSSLLPGSRVGAYLDSEEPLRVRIEGNSQGLKSIAGSVLALSASDLPNGGSISYDADMAILEPHSCELRIDRSRGTGVAEFHGPLGKDAGGRPARLVNLAVPVVSQSGEYRRLEGGGLTVLVFGRARRTVGLGGSVQALLWLGRILLAASHESVQSGGGFLIDRVHTGSDPEVTGSGILAIRRMT